MKRANRVLLFFPSTPNSLLLIQLLLIAETKLLEAKLIGLNDGFSQLETRRIKDN